MQKLKCINCGRYMNVSEIQFEAWRQMGRPNLVCDDCLEIKEEENEQKRVKTNFKGSC